MNFFKSIISDDPDPPKPESSHESGSNSPIKPSEEDRSPNNVVVEDGGGWSFGGLMKTLATRSESVIETYSRDLKEFQLGLRKESEIIKEAASRAVKELPASIEAGTSAASGVIDGMIKSTAEIISKEVQVFASDGEPETPEASQGLNSNTGRYSRFDAQLSVIQSDLNTFCEEPEDLEEYKDWKSRFELDDKRDEIGDLIWENGNLEGVYKKVVPDLVDHETFWCRYFYRVDKLKLKEKARENLVKRAISADEDDDELSWDVDDDDDDDDEEDKKKDDTLSEVKSIENQVDIGESLNDGSQNKKEELNPNVDDEVKSNPVEQSSEENRELVIPLDEKEVKPNEVVAEVKSEEKTKPEESLEEKSSGNVGVVEKGEPVEKGSLNHQVKTEEDLGWDEIEDIGSDDDKKISTSSNSERPNRAEVRKLIVAEDDEDLSWDIEDDDEPVKSSLLGCRDGAEDGNF